MAAATEPYVLYDGSIWEQVVGPLTPNGGTVVAGANSKFYIREGDFITPEMFGAKADGVTINTSAINAAVQAASQQQKPLYFGNGVYLCDPITINSSIIIKMSEKATLKLNGSASRVGDTLILLTIKSSNVTISGGTIDYNRDGLNRSAFNIANKYLYIAVFLQGSQSIPLNNINIRTKIINGVDKSLYALYTNNCEFSLIFNNCCAGPAFEYCSHIQFNYLIANNIDNLAWRIFPHAIDFFNCKNINIDSLIIMNQSGYYLLDDDETKSDWFSGLTMVNSHHFSFGKTQVIAKKDSNMMKSVGISFLGCSNIKMTNIEVRRYTDVNFEVGGCSDLHVTNGLIDCEYQPTSLWPATRGTCLNIYNNAYYSDFKSRSTRPSTNINFVNVNFRRSLGLASQMRSLQNSSFVNCNFESSSNGVYIDEQNIDASNVAQSTSTIEDLRFINCRFWYNEYRGVSKTSGTRAHFINCIFANNGQAKTNAGNAFRHGGGTLTLLTPGFDTYNSQATPPAIRTGTRLYAPLAFDDQTVVSNGSFNPDSPTIISLDRPASFYYGQSIRALGVGVSGTNLITQVYDIDKDEIIIFTPLTTIPLVPGTGTISVNNPIDKTEITGTGTAFLSEITGRFWIKVNNQYRQIVKVQVQAWHICHLLFQQILHQLHLRLLNLTLNKLDLRKWVYE